MIIQDFIVISANISLVRSNHYFLLTEKNNCKQKIAFILSITNILPFSPIMLFSLSNQASAWSENYKNVLSGLDE